MSDCLPPVGWVQTGHGWRVWVTVTPNGKRSEWLYHENGQLRGLRLGAPATEGRANAELVRFIAGQFGVAKSRVTLHRGQTSHIKQLTVEGGTAPVVG